MNRSHPPLAADSGLLDTLSQRAGCGFLSDLHLPVFRSRALCAIRQTPASEFSLDEWLKAAHYLTDSKQQFECADDARTFVLGWLQAADKKA